MCESRNLSACERSDSCYDGCSCKKKQSDPQHLLAGSCAVSGIGTGTDPDLASDRPYHSCILYRKWSISGELGRRIGGSVRERKEGSLDVVRGTGDSGSDRRIESSGEQGDRFTNL